MARGSGLQGGLSPLYSPRAKLKAQRGSNELDPALRPEWPPGLEQLDARRCLELLGPEERGRYQFPRGFKSHHCLYAPAGVRLDDEWGRRGLGWRWLLTVGRLRERLPGSSVGYRDQVVLSTLRGVARGLAMERVFERQSHGDDLAAAIKHVALAEAKELFGPEPDPDLVTESQRAAAWEVATALRIARANCSGWERLENFGLAVDPQAAATELRPRRLRDSEDMVDLVPLSTIEARLKELGIPHASRKRRRLKASP